MVNRFIQANNIHSKPPGDQDYFIHSVRTVGPNDRGLLEMKKD